MCDIKNENLEKIHLEISDIEVNHRLDQLEQVSMPEDLRDYIIRSLKVLVELDRIVGLQKTTIARLRKIFGKKSEKCSSKSKDNDNTSDKDENDASKEKEKRPKSKGHGRNGHDDYENAPEENFYVTNFTIGDTCPECISGKLYEYAPRYQIVITGGPPFQAKKEVHQVLRCNICGWIIEAKSDSSINGKYDLTVRSMLAYLHYNLNLPLYRIEKLQKNFCTPIPRSVQWKLIDELAMSVMPIWDVFIIMTSNADTIIGDDTGAKIQNYYKNVQIIDGKERQKLSTTGMLATVEGHEIVTFYTGPKNCGENLDATLEKRETNKEITLMTDGSSSNNTKKIEGKKHLNCLVHSRRQFIDTEAAYLQESAQIIEWIGEVYKNEKITKEEGLSSKERLKFHKKNSGKPMAALKGWCRKAFINKLVEPNSAFGKAITYLLKRWPEVTGFLRIEGTPLDTNLIEQQLRVPVMNRKNWLGFKTQYGAFVGDVLLSIIKTCEKTSENSFEYLNTLQKYESAMRTEPEKWLPWNYRNSIEALKSD